MKILQKERTHLRVKFVFAAILIAIDKGLGETCNYTKGDGEKLLHRMRHEHPGSTLFPVERAGVGSRQDSCSEGAGAIYLTRPFYVDYLDDTLREHGKKNILLENLFIVLTSLDVIAYARVSSIIHCAILMPLR